MFLVWVFGIGHSFKLVNREKSMNYKHTFGKHGGICGGQPPTGPQ